MEAVNDYISRELVEDAALSAHGARVDERDLMERPWLSIELKRQVPPARTGLSESWPPRRPVRRRGCGAALRRLRRQRALPTGW